MKTKNLQPQFIDPYQILRKVGTVAYQLALTPHISNLHDVFHVSQLQKYVSDPSHILEVDDIPLKPRRFISVEAYEDLRPRRKDSKKQDDPISEGPLRKR
jgi:hypothetical protein